MESLAHQGCIYLQNTEKKLCCEILLQFQILFSYFNTYTLKYNLFLWRKAEFSASLLQSSVSHDPLESILICWFIISVADLICWFTTVKLLCCLIYFWNVLLFSLIKKSSIFYLLLFSFFFFFINYFSLSLFLLSFFIYCYYFISFLSFFVVIYFL